MYFFENAYQWQLCKWWTSLIILAQSSCTSSPATPQSSGNDTLWYTPLKTYLWATSGDFSRAWWRGIHLGDNDKTQSALISKWVSFNSAWDQIPHSVWNNCNEPEEQSTFNVRLREAVSHPEQKLLQFCCGLWAFQPGQDHVHVTWIWAHMELCASVMHHNRHIPTTTARPEEETDEY